MAIVTLLIIVTASALIPLDNRLGAHSALGMLSGCLAIGLLGMDPIVGAKLAVSTGLTTSSVFLLGQLVLITASLVCLSTWGGFPLLTLALVNAGTLILAAQLPALIVTALELQSYAAYGVIALGGLRTHRAIGAGTYFLLGAAATASFMIGWALLTQGGGLALLHRPDSTALGWICTEAGMLAKLGCFPFVWWLPLAYAGTNYAALGLIAVLPQFSLFVQSWSLCPVEPETAYVIATASVAWASLLSASSSHIRPLLALSGAAHVGYTLSGVTFTLEPLIIYTGVYALTFTLLGTGLAANSSLHVSDLRGYLNVFLLPGLSLQAALLSLAGIPPLLGFFTKALVLLGGVCLTNSFAQPCLLVLLGVTGTVAYLRVVLAIMGYPQSGSYALTPASEALPGSQAFLLVSVLFAGGLSGEPYSLLFS